MGMHRIYNNPNYEILSDLSAEETGYLRQIRCRCPTLLSPWDCCDHHAVRPKGMVTQNIIDVADDELISLTFLRNSFVCEECGCSAIAWDPEYPPSETITPQAQEFMASQVISEYYSHNRSDIVPLLKHYIQSGLECLTGTYRERFSDISSWAYTECLRFYPINYQNRSIRIVMGSGSSDGKKPFLITLLPDIADDTLKTFCEKLPEPERVKLIMTEIEDPILSSLKNNLPSAAFTYSKESVSELFRKNSGDPGDSSYDHCQKQASLLFQRLFNTGSTSIRGEISRWEDKMLLDKHLSTRSRNILRRLLDQLMQADFSSMAEVRNYPSRWLDCGTVSTVLNHLERTQVSYPDAEIMILRSDACQYRTEGLPRKTGYYVEPDLLRIQYLEDSSLYLFLQMDTENRF